MRWEGGGGLRRSVTGVSVAVCAARSRSGLCVRSTLERTGQQQVSLVWPRSVGMHVIVNGGVRRQRVLLARKWWRLRGRDGRETESARNRRLRQATAWIRTRQGGSNAISKQRRKPFVSPRGRCKRKRRSKYVLGRE